MAATTSLSNMINNASHLTTQLKQIFLKSFRHQYGLVKVVADTTVNASTTLTPEPELKFSVQKGKMYHVRARLMISTGATPGLEIQLAAPACTTSATTFVGKALATQGTANVAGVTLAYTSLNADLFSSAVAYSSITVDAFFQPEADDTINFTFCQNTSNASNTSILRGSWMSCVEVRNGGSYPTSL